MSNLAAEIDHLVREVMQRLGSDMRAGKPHGESHSQALDRVVNGPSHSLVLRQPLISLADVVHRVDEGMVISVLPGTVITPSARDYLRGKLARLEVSGGRTPSWPSSSPERTLILAIACARLPVDAAERAVQKTGWPMQRIPHTGLPGTVAEMAEAIGLGGSAGVLFTDETAAALCLANRHKGVRAASAASVVDVDAAAEAIGLNLLVLCPEGKSHWQLQRMVQKFCERAADCERARYFDALR